MVAVFLVVAAWAGYSYFETFWVETTRYDFISPEVPAEFDGTTIVLLTDVHRGWSYSEERIRNLVERINALQPDIVALGGDYVLGDGDTDLADSAFAVLSGLEAPLGRFAVLGNHDYEMPETDSGTDYFFPAAEELASADVRMAIEANGIELLDDRAVWLERDGARIRLGGVSDFWNGSPDLGPTVEETRAEDLVILLSHNPDYAESLPPGYVDLVLSGHTHGGQITLFGLWAPYVPSDYGQKYRSGMVQNGSTTVIVSRGVGNSPILPLRFFARPQIVEITLRAAGHTPSVA